MPWPLIKLVPLNSNIKFVRFAFFASFASIFAVFISIASMFTGGLRENPVAIYQAASGSPGDRMGAIMLRGFNLGIDFRGGTLIEIEAPNPIDLAHTREALTALEMGDIQVQGFGDPRHVAVRFHTVAQDAQASVDIVNKTLQSVVPGVRVVRTEVVGPKVSGELFTSGLIALGLAMLLVMVYIWVRFDLQFGWGAVLSLLHDTILTLGVFSIFRLDFTLPVIAGLLTVIGYSMNDTVVVFDRMRENFRKYRKKPTTEVIDMSINETLSRTTVTAATALLASVALYLYGGETLRSFAICMLFGIVVATYSSIYIAAPALPLFGDNPNQMGSGGEKKDPEPKSAG